MRFDFGSFIIGAIVAFAISFVAYRRREELSVLWQKIRARLEAIKRRRLELAQELGSLAAEEDRLHSRLHRS